MKKGPVGYSNGNFGCLASGERDRERECCEDYSNSTAGAEAGEYVTIT